MSNVFSVAFIVNSVFLTPLPPLDASHFPESGHWHDPERPGEGVFVDRQGDSVGFTFFTHEADGNPVFYVAGGVLEAATDLGHGQQRISARLGKTENGPVFNSPARYRIGDDPAYRAMEVGTLTAVFDQANRLKVSITLDEGQVPEGSEAVREHYYQRLAFGYETLGKNIDPERAVSSPGCWVDLRGLWVFASARDQEEGGAALHRYNFTGFESRPALENMTCNGSEMSHVLFYSDDRGNTMRCISADADLATLGVEAAENEKGRCVVRDAEGAGEPVLWFAVSDIGLKQILASPGAPPETEGAVSEGSQALLLGVRLK